jgi:hypothetical protein
MEAAAVTEAYGAARELLDRAEEDAARSRSDADRYRRQREQEAELLVAKARRLLSVAEQKAVVIGQTPRAPRVIDLAAEQAPDHGSADAIVPTGLDSMLRSAITRAFDTSYRLGP